MTRRLLQPQSALPAAAQTTIGIQCLPSTIDCGSQIGSAPATNSIDQLTKAVSSCQTEFNPRLSSSSQTKPLLPDIVAKQDANTQCIYTTDEVGTSCSDLKPHVCEPILVETSESGTQCELLQPIMQDVQQNVERDCRDMGNQTVHLECDSDTGLSPVRVPRHRISKSAPKDVERTFMEQEESVHDLIDDLLFRDRPDKLNRSADDMHLLQKSEDEVVFASNSKLSFVNMNDADISEMDARERFNQQRLDAGLIHAGIIPTASNSQSEDEEERERSRQFLAEADSLQQKLDESSRLLSQTQDDIHDDDEARVDVTVQPDSLLVSSQENFIRELEVRTEIAETESRRLETELCQAKDDIDSLQATKKLLMSQVQRLRGELNENESRHSQQLTDAELRFSQQLESMPKPALPPVDESVDLVKNELDILRQSQQSLQISASANLQRAKADHHTRERATKREMDKMLKKHEIETARLEEQSEERIKSLRQNLDRAYHRKIDRMRIDIDEAKSSQQQRDQWLCDTATTFATFCKNLRDTCAKAQSLDEVQDVLLSRSSKFTLPECDHLMLPTPAKNQSRSKDDGDDDAVPTSIMCQNMKECRGQLQLIVRDITKITSELFSQRWKFEFKAWRRQMLMYKYLFKWMTYRQKGFTQRKARLEAFANQSNSLLPVPGANKPPLGANDKPRISTLLTPNPEEARRLRMSLDSLDMSNAGDQSPVLRGSRHKKNTNGVQNELRKSSELRSSLLKPLSSLQDAPPVPENSKIEVRSPQHPLMFGSRKANRRTAEREKENRSTMSTKSKSRPMKDLVQLQAERQISVLERAKVEAVMRASAPRSEKSEVVRKSQSILGSVLSSLNLD